MPQHLSANWHACQHQGVPTGAKRSRYSCGMGRSDSVDKETRRQIAARLRQYMHENERTPQQVAKDIGEGVRRETIVKILNGSRGAGLDIVLKFHRKLGLSYIQMLEDPPPPKEFFEEGSETWRGPPSAQTPAKAHGAGNRGLA
jgi:hypothetical protein